MSTTSAAAKSKGPSPAVMGTYGRIDVTFDRGEGSWLIAKDGDRYLDFGSGIAVNALGHAHPALVAALAEMMLGPRGRADLGLDVDLAALPGAGDFERMFSDPDTLYLKAFYPGGIYFDATTGGNNIKEITAGLDAGGAEGDPAKRREIYKGITQNLVNHAPWIFLFNYPFSYGVSDKVKNYKPLANDWYFAGGGIPYATLD